MIGGLWSTLGGHREERGRTPAPKCCVSLCVCLCMLLSRVRHDSQCLFHVTTGMQLCMSPKNSDSLSNVDMESHGGGVVAWME